MSFLKFFVSSLKTVFASISKPFFYFITLFFVSFHLNAANYIPLETLSDEQKAYFPNSIQALNNEQLELDFDKFAAKIFYIADNDHYTALMPDDSRLTVTIKNAAMIVTWINSEQKSYKTALYRREDLRLPKKGRYFRTAPDRDDYFVSSPNFIESYAFWTGDEVMHAYDLLSYKEQGVLKLFPYISAEILSKLCNADTKNAGFIKLLAHHKISCSNLSAQYHTLQNSANFSNFQNHLENEKKLAANIFACNHGLIRPAQCRDFQKQLSLKALSPQSVQSTLK